MSSNDRLCSFEKSDGCWSLSELRISKQFRVKLARNDAAKPVGPRLLDGLCYFVILFSSM